jgi:hypothetical protein
VFFRVAGVGDWSGSRSAVKLSGWRARCESSLPVQFTTS